MGHAAAPDRCDRALRRSSDQRARRNQSLMDQLKHLIEVWTSYAQGLTGSIGALAFVCAFIWMIARLDELFISVNGPSLLPASGPRLIVQNIYGSVMRDRELLRWAHDGI